MFIRTFDYQNKFTMKVHFSLTVILVINSFLFFSQESLWKKSYENDEINIESKIDEIISSNSDTLRFISFCLTNKKNYEIKKNINFKLKYVEGCYGCDGENEETKCNLTLKANDKLFGNPINKTNPELYFIIFNSKFESQWHFKSFEIELLD